MHRPDATLTVRLSGEWKLGRQLPRREDFRRQIASAGTVNRIAFDTQAMTGWDSGLITFLMRIVEICFELRIPLQRDGLPEGVQAILALASAVPERTGVRREKAKTSFLDRIGDSAIVLWRSSLEMLTFIGGASIALI